MQSLTFVLEASLLAPLVEFATSSSGHVEPRQGLALGWLGSVVAGLVVVFGTANRTQADPCYGIPDGLSGWVCSDSSDSSDSTCAWDNNGKPLSVWKYLYTHDVPNGCEKTGHRSCDCFLNQGVPATAVAAETMAPPAALALGANYPNPFNPATIIPVSVAAGAGDVDVTIYNVLGQPVRQVWNGPLAAGEHRLTWDGRDAQGQSVAAGVYLYRLHVGNHTRLRKMVKLE